NPECPELCGLSVLSWRVSAVPSPEYLSHLRGIGLIWVTESQGDKVLLRDVCFRPLRKSGVRGTFPILPPDILWSRTRFQYWSNFQEPIHIATPDCCREEMAVSIEISTDTSPSILGPGAHPCRVPVTLVTDLPPDEALSGGLVVNDTIVSAEQRIDRVSVLRGMRCLAPCRGGLELSAPPLNTEGAAQQAGSWEPEESNKTDLEHLKQLSFSGITDPRLLRQITQTFTSKTNVRRLPHCFQWMQNVPCFGKHFDGLAASRPVKGWRFAICLTANNVLHLHLSVKQRAGPRQSRVNQVPGHRTSRDSCIRMHTLQTRQRRWLASVAMPGLRPVQSHPSEIMKRNRPTSPETLDS
ncbi:hypothetical protein BaRGS_00007076, partial [Batillaria attramentaria]